MLLNFYLGSLVSTVIEFYRQLKNLAHQSNHRQLCCLQGEQSWCFEQATVIVDDECADYQWCGESPTTITTSPYSSLLGQDVELLFLNMLDGFDANMFAAAEGSVSGGGIIVLLLSDKVIATDLFYQYITKQLALHEFPIWQQHQSLPAVQSSAIPAVSNKLDLAEQKQAIQHIIKTVTGHRRRPLVLTANRGRGKSAALGIAAATLINKGLNKILVCAPSKQSVSTSIYCLSMKQLQSQLSYERFLQNAILVWFLPQPNSVMKDLAVVLRYAFNKSFMKLHLNSALSI